MAVQRHRANTPLPAEAKGFGAHEEAARAAGRTLPELPWVLIELLGGPARAEGVVAALEAHPSLGEAVAASFGKRGTRGLWALAPDDVVDRVADVGVRAFLASLPPPLDGSGGRLRTDLLLETAAVARQLARTDGVDRRAQRDAWLAGALHLLGVVGFEAYLRAHWPSLADRLATGAGELEACGVSLGCSVWRLGGALLASRGLPESVWRPVAAQEGGSASAIGERLLRARRRALREKIARQ